MTKIVYVHGTGVRTASHSETVRRIAAGLARHAPDIRLIAPPWGDTLGVPAVENLVIPGYRPGPATVDESESVQAQDARWLLLDLDPLQYLRLLEIQFGWNNGAAAGRIPGREPTSVRLQRLGSELAARPETVRGLREALHASRLTDHFGPALAWVLASAPCRRAAELINTQAGWGELAETVAEAAVAYMLLSADDRSHPVAGVSRTHLVRLVTDGLKGGQLAGGGRLAVRLTLRLATVIGMVDSRRGPLDDRTSPLVGDILRYLAHGEPLRQLIADAADEAGEDIILMGHSLGGIACLDTLLERSCPSVRALVTVGSQGPKLHQMGALPSLRAGDTLPEVPWRWVNVYSRRDLLSYQAGAVFPQAEDLDLTDSHVMPEAHSAYFEDKRLYECLGQLAADIAVPS